MDSGSDSFHSKIEIPRAQAMGSWFQTFWLNPIMIDLKLHSERIHLWLTYPHLVDVYVTLGKRIPYMDPRLAFLQLFDQRFRVKHHEGVIPMVATRNTVTSFTQDFRATCGTNLSFQISNRRGGSQRVIDPWWRMEIYQMERILSFNFPPQNLNKPNQYQDLQFHQFLFLLFHPSVPFLLLLLSHLFWQLPGP